MLINPFSSVVVGPTSDVPQLPDAVSSAFTSLLAIDMTARAMLYDKDSAAYFSPVGSAVTLMTAYIVAAENDPNTEIIIETTPNLPYDARTIGIRGGQLWRVDDLLAAMLLYGAQDAALVLAEHIAGDAESFADHMNEYASTLGMEHTRYISPLGAYEREQTTTTQDLALLAAAVHDNENLRMLLAQSEYQPAGDHDPIGNRLRFMQAEGNYYDARVIGMGTGMSGSSGINLVVMASSGGREILLIAYSASSSQSTAERAIIDALDFAYDHYKLYDCAPVITRLIHEYTQNASDDLLVTYALPVSQALVAADTMLADAMEVDPSGFSLQVGRLPAEDAAADQHVVDAQLYYYDILIINLTLDVYETIPLAPYETGLVQDLDIALEDGAVDPLVVAVPKIPIYTSADWQPKSKQGFLEKYEWLLIIACAVLFFSCILAVGVTVRKKMKQ